MPLPGFIGKLLSGGVGDIVEKVGTVADKFIRTKEEKDAFALELMNAKADIELKAATLEKDINEAYLKDTQDARSNNAAIQNSDKASWMAKNIAYVIDIILTVLWSSVTVILFLKIFKIAATEVDMISLMALHGTVTAVFMTVLNFHRGTSKGSEDKSKELKELNKNK